MGGIISSIEPGSIAEDLGWEPGDELVSINGHELRDIIDYQFYCSDEHVQVVLKRGNSTLEYEIEKDIDLDLGVEFAELLFDGIRICGAHCVFCFVDQLPKGLRKSLYLKDDDYRLSFLDGNFTTLVNVTERDLNRIVEQRLSPFYVSIHCTDHALRERILGRSCPDIIGQLRKLAAGRISVHAQIVLCRGINDGLHLEKTVRDLSNLFPTIASIAIVPAAITSRSKNKDLIKPIDASYSARLLDEISQWQRTFLKTLGTRLIWAADEFYLSAGRSVPGRQTYEQFPQISNGVGLVRLFEDSLRHAVRKLYHLTKNGMRWHLRYSVITGVLAAPLLQTWSKWAMDCGLEILVYPIRNTLFGESVTVAGLISGRDVIEQLQHKELGDYLLIPDVALRDGIFLDDVTLAEVENRLGVSVLCVEPLPHLVAKRLVEHAKGGA
ncbi:MAG: DUF512 domain-containing protein [Armatimonadota bacterium]